MWKRLAVVAIGVVALGDRPEAQGNWMPPQAAEGVALEMAKRLDHVKVGIEEAKLLPSARAGVAALRERLDTLGEKGVLTLAPRFPQIEIPFSGQPHLDAMARFSMCTYYLDARFERRPANVDVDALLDAAMGPLSLAVTTMYLRHHFLAAGGTDDQIKMYLDGDPLNEVAAAVQTDPKLLDHTAAECRAAVSTLLD